MTTSGRPTSRVEWSGRDSSGGMSGISGFESHSLELAKWPPEPVVVANAKCRGNLARSLRNPTPLLLPLLSEPSLPSTSLKHNSEA